MLYVDRPMSLLHFCNTMYNIHSLYNTKSNHRPTPNSDPNPNHTTRQHAIVSIQLNIA